jgi:hypothetical protein
METQQCCYLKQVIWGGFDVNSCRGRETGLAFNGLNLP